MSDITTKTNAEIRRAVEQLEAPGFLIKAVSWLGSPIEGGLDKLPRGARDFVGKATRKALNLALDASIKTMDLGVQSPARNVWHKLVAGASGAAGGAFGLAGLAFELPVSTAVMLRSIADIARAEGEDLRTVEARLRCLSVFGMGGRSARDDASETVYYASRTMLGKVVSEAASFAVKNAGHTAGKQAAPALAKLLSLLTQRFAPQVAEKVLAMGVPIIGAAGGTAINLLFIDHYQSVAHGHFTMRRLEREHGAEVVKTVYEKLAQELRDRRA